MTFPCVGDLGERRHPGPSYIHELWGPKQPSQALGLSMENLPARLRSASPEKEYTQRLVLDGGGGVSWVGLDTAVAEASGALAASPCPLTWQLQRQ